MTTSPVPSPETHREIEEVLGDQIPAPSPSSAREEWRRYAAFLKRPSLVPMDQSDNGVRAVLRMLGLDLMIMLVLIGGISAAAAAGFELPNNVNNSLDPGLVSIALVVIAAPLLEEIAFRSWLRGHPAIIAVVIVLVVGFGALPALGMSMQGTTAGMVLTLAGPLFAIVGVPLSAYFLLRRDPPAIFRRAFPVFFWLSTLAFALIHLGNYTEGSLAILLPLVLPQFALGTMLGYLRVHHGLAHAIALHAAHNAILFSLAIAGGLGGEAEAFWRAIY